MGTLRINPDLDAPMKAAAAATGQSVTKWANGILRAATIAALSPDAPRPAPPDPEPAAATTARPATPDADATPRRRRRSRPPAPVADGDTACAHTNLERHSWGTLCADCKTRLR